MADSKIEWTDKTWNPITGCQKVSPGCKNCYMHRMYPRLKGMGTLGYEASPNTATLLPSRLKDPAGWRKPSRVFVCSMSDLFQEAVPMKFIDQVFEVMAATLHRGHTYLVLTKRPDRMAMWWRTSVWAGTLGLERIPDGIQVGTSVELQSYANRIRALSSVPASVRFVSAEPLLGPLDIEGYLDDGSVNWVIVGGESGPGSRPMRLSWAESLRDQCDRQAVPFFLKQLGGVKDKRGGEKAVLDGTLHHAIP